LAQFLGGDREIGGDVLRRQTPGRVPDQRVEMLQDDVTETFPSLGVGYGPCTLSSHRPPLRCAPPARQLLAPETVKSGAPEHFPFHGACGGRRLGRKAGRIRSWGGRGWRESGHAGK